MSFDEHFIEVGPDSFKTLKDCSRSEIETKVMSLTMQAQALIEEAKALDQYLEKRDAAG